MSGPDSIGRLDRRLVLEAATRSPDGAGGVTLGWAPVAILWARVAIGAGGEAFDADRTRGSRPAVITLRHRNGLASDMRFRDGERTYEILSVAEAGGRRQWMVCQCEERDL